MGISPELSGRELTCERRDGRLPGLHMSPVERCVCVKERERVCVCTVRWGLVNSSITSQSTSVFVSSVVSERV